MYRKGRGFTLIELLVVIAIIGILAAVVLAALNSARIKGRDARRLSDIKQLQNALVLYYSDNTSQYPLDIYDTTSGLTATYIPTVPTDPLTAANYDYTGLTDGVGTDCVAYHLGTTLEDTSHPALQGDIDAAASTDVCDTTTPDVDFDGADTTATPATTVYDVVS